MESPKIDGNIFELLTDATTLAFFPFLGMESASVISKSTKNPEKTIKRATLLGTFVTGLAYLLSYVVIAQTIPQEALLESNAPFADTRSLWGVEARYTIAGAAVIATLGALNGWLLIR